MLNFLLIVHIIVTLFMIIVILMQKTNNDGLSGISGGGLGGVISTRTSANILTKLTKILATIFILNSLLLANLFGKASNDRHNMIEQIEQDDSISIE